MSFQELSYCDLPFQLNIMILRFIHAAAFGNGPLISCSVIFHPVILLLCNVPSWKEYNLLYISCWWTFGLLMGFLWLWTMSPYTFLYKVSAAQRQECLRSGIAVNNEIQYFSQFSSVQSLSRVRLFATPWTAARQASLVSPTPGPYSNSCPLSWWGHPTISSSVVPFSSCPQSLPASGSFPMSQLFTWGGQSIGVSASASVLPMNIQDWFSLGWMGWISLQSKGLSRVFSNTTVQKHQFFGTQLSL